MANEVIKAEARRAGVPLWKVAQRLNISDGNLSRKLRVEFPEQTRDEILAIIAELKNESG